jgi:hypothetical protein
MSSPLLWMSIEPTGTETRLMLSVAGTSTSIKARLPAVPAHPRALMTMLEALSLWYGQPLHAVLDADASDVRRHPERWAELLADAPELCVHVEWAAVPVVRQHDRFLETLGDFSTARRLLTHAATGQR